MDTSDRASLGLHRLGFLLAAIFFVVGSVASFWIATNLAETPIYAEFVRKLWSNYAICLSVTLSVSTGIYFIVRAIGTASWRLGEEAMAHRLGRVLYRICVGLAVFWVVFGAFRFFTDFAELPLSLHLLLFGLPALLLYGLGRAFRYVLAGD